jgi:YGGT family
VAFSALVNGTRRPDALTYQENLMATDQVDQTVVTKEPTATGQQTVQTNRRLTTTGGPGATELTRRIIILLFGLVQIVIAARFVLLLVDAREANSLVSGILNVSQLFVAPFDGILRTDNLHVAGSVVDFTAIVAFVGWTVLELIVLWAVGIFRREPA